jgi:pyruvate/2-oxoglutarate/acetoin dehydrogenase E1 component
LSGRPARPLEVADRLETERISAEVIDLRSVQPLDTKAILESASRTGHVLVVDEDYEQFGLSGEIAAALLESGLSHVAFSRVCTRTTIPFSRKQEAMALPNTDRIAAAARLLLNSGG